MSNPSHKPAGFPGLFPYLTVKDASLACKFYESAFGFKLSSPPSKYDNGHIQHAEMNFGDEIAIMFAPEGAWGSSRKTPNSLKVQPSLTLYLYCEDVDAFYERAIRAGAQSVTEPADGFWGDRFCTLVDPDGHEWIFATYLGDPTHQHVNK